MWQLLTASSLPNFKTFPKYDSMNIIYSSDITLEKNIFSSVKLREFDGRKV